MKQQLFLGVDIGGTKCSVVLGRANGTILAQEYFLTSDVNTTIDGLKAACDKLQAAAPAPLVAGGISCGGPLHAPTGVVLSPPNLPGWNNIPITQILTEACGLPFALENDANACALAEWQLGAGQGSRHMVFLTLGTGLGAGIIANGDLIAGANGFAGEIGHIRLAPDGPRGYGKNGSFEGFCSGGGIAQYIPRALGVRSVKEAAALAQQGNPVALELFKQVGTHLGRGLALLIDILNPEVIVMGSIFIRCQQFISPSMWAEIKLEALEPAWQACRVVPAQLGEQIGDIAALNIGVRLYEKLQSKR